MKLAEIKISERFAAHPPAPTKMEKCRRFYKEHGTIDRNIVVNSNNVLVDGYVAYLVLKENGVPEVEVKKEFNIFDYRQKETTYVYGYHQNDPMKSPYIWRITNKTVDSDRIQEGSRILVYTKNGTKVVIVIKVEKNISPPIEQSIKKVIRCFKD